MFISPGGASPLVDAYGLAVNAAFGHSTVSDTLLAHGTLSIETANITTNVGSLRLERRIGLKQEGVRLSSSSISVVRVPVRIDSSTRAAITRKSDTRIVEVAQSPPVRIMVCISVF